MLRALLVQRDCSRSVSEIMQPLLLFIHGSADLYGSDRVLLSVVRDCAERSPLKPIVVLPEVGPLTSEFAGLGIEVHAGQVAKISRSMLSWRAPVEVFRQVQAARNDIDRIIGDRPVSLVYSNTMGVLGGAFWARHHRIPHLWHVHETVTSPRLVGNGLCRLVDFLADRVIANSSPTREWLLRQAPGLAARCEIVHNGVSPLDEIPSLEVASIRAGIGAGPEDLVAACVGRLNHIKGQDLLVDALHLLRQGGRLSSLRVLLVGDVYAGHPDYKAMLEDRVRRYGLNDRVSFLPFERQIHRIWRACDLAVVPSLQPEGFGLVAVEAMACGVPVVAANHGGLVDIIEHERSGLLFQPGSAQSLADSLYRMAMDSGLRERLGREALSRQASLFSLQRQLERTRALYIESACLG